MKRDFDRAWKWAEIVTCPAVVKLGRSQALWFNLSTTLVSKETKSEPFL